MIQILKDSDTRPWFFLQTAHTTYGMWVMETGHLEHLYYGERITVDSQDPSSCAPLVIQRAFAPGNTCTYDREHPQISMEDVCLEVGTLGKGDIREPFLEVRFADGSVTSDFTFDSYEIITLKEREQCLQDSGLPHSYSEVGTDSAECLQIVLQDVTNHLELQLFYTVFEECDVITRSARLINHSDASVTLNRCLSAQLDLTEDYSMITHFSGAWAREMHREQISLRSGKFVNASYTGTSSNRSNPFMILGHKNTCETFGSCIGCNLIYSGNHYEALEKDSYGKLRFVSGINPQSFSWELTPEAHFDTPEAVLSYSSKGYGRLSRQLHSFIREHIVRGVWKRRPRPVLLNSWEACYFKIDERKLLQLAKAGADVGIELFVMDDGWFSGRNDDTSSLGDWEPDPKKLPGGIASLSKKIKALGVDFGLWVEPEMISENSRLYQEHPDWAMMIPEHPHSEGRNQRLLDLCNPEVQQYVIDSMTKVFSSGDIRYVKWDMNREHTDLHSNYLPEDRQGELEHRYMLAVYELQERLTKEFPNLLLENCSGGGARFDAGMLYYSPQIWCSDDTDAIERLAIQEGTALIYPLSAMGAHVSDCPNHTVGRVTPFKTRGDVALCGTFGYELDITRIPQEDRDAIPGQIAAYHRYNDLVRNGDYYRLASYQENNIYDCYMVVSKDRKEALLTYVQVLNRPNFKSRMIKLAGLAPDKKYKVLYEGADENNNSGSDGENQIQMLYGDTLMSAGLRMPGMWGDFKSTLIHLVAE